MAALETLFPGVHVLTLPLEDFAVRVVVLAGARRVVLFDTGCAPADLAPVLPLLSRPAGPGNQRSGQEPRQVLAVYSHGDWDHVQGSAAVPDLCGVVAHAACARRFADDVPARLSRLRSEFPGRYDAVELIPPDITFPGALTLDLGGLTLQLFHVPGHTADCLVGFVPEHGLLLAGDTAETPWPCLDWPKADIAAIDRWIQALACWRQDPRVRLVLPSHGRMGGPETLDETIHYLTALRDGIDPVPPATLDAVDPFYRDSHQANLLRIASLRRPA